VADEIADVHDRLVAELAPQPSETWLDVGTGTGAVAVRAARAGAKVTGSDLAPALIETAKRLADEEGLEIRYEVGDAEQLPYADGSYDIVSSSFAAIFAPTHDAVARELARVTRAGGRIGLTAWDPEGGIGDSFRLLGRSSRHHRRERETRSTGDARSTPASSSKATSTSGSYAAPVRRPASPARRCGSCP
jgi:ubiquinone/menaquinone biosynthesis C-methylase UbiE